MKALKNHEDSIISYLPYLIQFALLFHSDLSQSLLKRLSKIMKLSYTNGTLSTKSIKSLIFQFQNKLKMYDKNKIFNGKDPIDIWANEAMKWAIGSRTLKYSSTSLIILKHLEYSIDQETTKVLLNGVLKSMNYFLKNSLNSEKDKYNNPIYDYIDETFNLFIRHFKGNETLCLNYVETFFDFAVSLDVYFSQIIPLYMMCLESPVTESAAKCCYIKALRTCFSKLEVDVKAKSMFYKFFEHNQSIELKFINYALKKTNPKLDSEITNILNSCNIETINNIIENYSLMICDGSNNLKKRIFLLTGKILNRYSKIILKKENNEQNKKDITDSYDYNSDKYALNKNALVVIFDEATSYFANMKESFFFVKELSKVDPNLPFKPMEEMKWSEIVTPIISHLAQFDIEMKTTPVSYCQDLNSISSLLNPQNELKILPFTNQYDFHENISKLKLTTNPLDKWVKTFSSIGWELLRKINGLSPRSSTPDGNFDILPIPDSFISDDKLKSKVETKVETIPSIFDFQQQLKNTKTL